MRNLIEYPITETEIIDTLNGIATGLDAMRVVGDVRPLCLRAAAEIVKAAGGMLRGIDRRLDESEYGDPLRYVTPWAEATKLVKAFRDTPK